MFYLFFVLNQSQAMAMESGNMNGNLMGGLGTLAIQGAIITAVMAKMKTAYPLLGKVFCN